MLLEIQGYPKYKIDVEHKQIRSFHFDTTVGKLLKWQTNHRREKYIKLCRDGNYKLMFLDEVLNIIKECEKNMEEKYVIMEQSTTPGYISIFTGTEAEVRAKCEKLASTSANEYGYYRYVNSCAASKVVWKN